MSVAVVAAKSPARPARRVLSLRLLVSGVAAGLMTCALLGAAVISERNARATLVEEIQRRLLLEARNLALTSSGVMLAPFPELTLQPIVADLLERREITLAVVLGLDGRVQAHPDARRLGSLYEKPAGLAGEPTRLTLAEGEQLTGDRSTMVASAPILITGGRRIGTAIVGLRRSYLDRAIESARLRQLMLLVALLVIGVALTLMIVGHLLRPIGALREGLDRIGRGDLDTPLAVRDHTEFGLLAETVNRMAARIKSAQREALERDRLAREVDLARQIQQSILPRSRVKFGQIVACGAQRAAAEVGGDYFDILPLRRNRVGLAIADVSGKGLAGCLVMSMLSALIRALRGTYDSPARLLVELERNLVPALERGSFVTITYGVLDPVTGTLRFASAGHTPALVWRASTRAVERRRSRSVPVGAIRNGALERMLHDEEVVLEPGDVLVQVTDGFSEAHHHRTEEQFGFDRISEVIAEHAQQGAEQVIAALQAAVTEWSGTDTPMDDETVLVVARDATPAAGTEGSDILDRLTQARRQGSRLALRADLAQLSRLGVWLRDCPDIGELDVLRAAEVESAIYEMCSNVIEHGLGEREEEELELWWVPSGEAPETLPMTDRIRAGYFLLRDRGTEFHPREDRPVDFTDREVRLRGRGLGLLMIRRIMSQVRYHPATPEGNLTLMQYDPEKRPNRTGGSPWPTTS
jgi:serine phosphatase RsbU (regulator of sigma subunit)/anti-sigma regulatory factor (Ser/Thr protein kinase)